MAEKEVERDCGKRKTLGLVPYVGAPCIWCVVFERVPDEVANGDARETNMANTGATLIPNFTMF